MSVCIKNVVLFLLLTLIVHFFLNILIEKRKKECFHNDEMLNYVMMKDTSKPIPKETPNDSLKDFPREVPKETSKDVQKETPKENTTCNVNINETNDMEFYSKQVKADCDLNQNKNILILKEYEDETDMNGGLLYDGLNAFDTFDIQYQPYE